MSTGPLGEPRRLDLGHHQPLRTLGDTHHDVLAWLQVLKSAAAQGLDVDEDVPRLPVAHYEAVTLGPVEPFDLGPLQRPGGLERPARRTPIHAVMSPEAAMTIVPATTEVIPVAAKA